MSSDCAQGPITPPAEPTTPQAQSPGKRPWTPPRIDELPRLTELTLDSIQGDGSTVGGGGTVF